MEVQASLMRAMRRVYLAAGTIVVVGVVDAAEIMTI